MEKRSHGQIRTHDRMDGLTTYSLRVRAYGRREVVTFGTDADSWTMRKAERALEQILAEIQAGVWRPPSMSAGGMDPTFHEFASRWWFARKSELRPTTQADYEWRLRKHLLPFFADFQVSAITIALVDEYRREKVIERERISAAAAAGGQSATGVGSGASHSATSRSTRPSCCWRTSSTRPSSTGCSQATPREASDGG